MFGDYDGDGDGYQIHGSRRVRWQDHIGWISSSTVYPTWGAYLVEERRRLLNCSYRIEERRNALREASSAASAYRWQTRDAYDKAAANRSISDKDVEVLSNTAWWAEQDYLRADKACNALFNALWKWQEKIRDIDKILEKIAITTPPHWHSSNCGICKEAAAALAALEERGPKA